MRNALAVDAALGCSTNTVLHLMAIAHEAEVDLKLEDFNEVAATTPNLVKLSPSGTDHMEDLHRAGGIMAVLKRLDEAGLVDGTVPTVAGVDMATQYRAAEVRDEEVIRPLDRPYRPTGGLAMLFGNLAPRGAVVKESAVLPQMLVHRGPARVFDDEPTLMEAIEADQHRAGLRGRHPLRGAQGRSGHARDAHAHLGAGRRRARRQRGAHHRRPLQRRQPGGEHRARGAGSARRRADRPGAGRRHHQHRHPGARV